MSEKKNASRVGEMRQSFSDGGLPDASTTAGAASEPLANLSGLHRKTYGGVLSGGRFSKRHVPSVDALGKEDRQAVLEDIRLDREARLQRLEERARTRPKPVNDKEDKLRRFREEMEANEEERRYKKVEALKAWLQKKEDEAQAKKARQDEMIGRLLEAEKTKQQRADEAAIKAARERETRLRWAESRKEKLKSTLLASKDKEAPLGGSAGTPPGSQPASALDLLKSASAPQLVQNRAPPKHLQPLAQSQRVVHRHIHHHVHYHEEDGSQDDEGGGAGYPSEDERRQIELASEARVKAQLESSRLPALDAFGGRGVDESFTLPGGDMARRKGLPKFAKGLEAAAGAYSDIRRPQY